MLRVGRTPSMTPFMGGIRPFMRRPFYSFLSMKYERSFLNRILAFGATKVDFLLPELLLKDLAKVLAKLVHRLAVSAAAQAKGVKSQPPLYHSRTGWKIPFPLLPYSWPLLCIKILLFLKV